MTDQYQSRLLAVLREHNNVRHIKDYKDNQVEVEWSNGSTEWVLWDNIFKKTIYEPKTKRTSRKKSKSHI